MRDFVLVVGGGPCGSIAAGEIARLGRGVRIYEEHARVGMPVQCSGLVSKTGLDSLKINYRRAVEQEIRGAMFHSPNGNTLLVRAREAKAFVINRTKFDQICADEAERSGAKIILKKRAGKEDALSAKIVIGADGANSSVARWFGFPKITEYIYCYQIDYENARVDDPRLVQVFLSNRLAPGLFGWVIPTSGESARVGVGVNAPSLLRTHFEKLLSLPQVSRVLEDAKGVSSLAGAIPVRVRKKTAKGKVLLVGDAAGQVKATTGGGVVFGGLCARLAGRIAAESLEGKTKPTEYERAWRKNYGRDLELHHRIRVFLNSLDDSRLEKYFALAKKLHIEKFLVRHGDMDRPTLMESAIPFGRALGANIFNIFTRI
ncbi:MAG: NAD(P)/FAD-dependent oxidoreductase [Candidatus Micrarchaeota archaeon]